MTRITTYDSADGMLRFEIIRGENGDVTLGFAGFPWHTHGDLLVGTCGPSEDAAIERFVEDLLRNHSIIAVYRQGKNISDICITTDPHTDLLSKSEDESIEFRHWDGSLYHPD